MVIDWNKQIDECIKNTKIMPIFHGTPFSYHLQNVLIVKRLNDMGYTKEQILNWMVLSGSINVTDTDIVSDLLLAANKKRWPKKHDFKIFITMEEINYIDNLKLTKEHKAYLLGLICFAKMMKIKHKSPSFKPQYRAYVYYIATGKDDYSSGRQCYKDINKFTFELAKKKIISFKDNHTKFIVYTENGPKTEEIHDSLFKAKWVDWDSNDGYCITNLESDVKMLVEHAFHDPERKCAQCGKMFVITPYTKTSLCHDCQKALERSRVEKWKLAHPGLKHSKPGVKHDKHKTHSHGKRDKKKIVDESGGGKYEIPTALVVNKGSE